jgi:dGTP triphosphohydrolase
MVIDIRQAQSIVADKLAASDGQLAEAEALKATLAEQVQANAESIAKTTEDIDNCLAPEILVERRVAKQQLLATTEVQAQVAKAEMAEAAGQVEQAQVHLDGHHSSVSSLQQVVADTNAVMANWESKMRKHIQKRKRLVALSNTFGVDVQDIQNRANDERSHFKESMRPLIVNAIDQLGELLKQLDSEP